jgi:predicted TIM-barrel fold metal-dependent hydrolase
MQEAFMRVISADSHTVEPADLWTSRLDRKFKDKAPHVEQQGNAAVLVAPGMRPFRVGAITAMGKSGDDLKKHFNTGYEAARPSGWDPAERVKDQAVDGVDAEVLYTSLGLPMFALPDVELQQACFRVYNDWLSEYCNYDRKRLAGIGLISTDDVGEAVKELERAAKLGLPGAQISGAPPADKPYSRPMYDPLWAAASDLQIPISLHVISGRRHIPTAEELKNPLETSDIVSGYLFLTVEVQQTFCDMITKGVLERFPKLKLVSAENDTGWLPHFMYRMDHSWDKFRTLGNYPALPLKPSEYMKRQLWATFLDDPVGPATYDFFGTDNYMWASDFPHSDSTWPRSREVIKADFAKVPEDVTRKIVFDNAAKLYHLGA